MTTATLTGVVAASRPITTGRNDRREQRQGRRSLEELAKNLVATLFGTAPETWI